MMAVFVVGISTTEAARKDPGLPGNHLVIERVDIDTPVIGQLTITGDHFDFGNTLAVVLGSPPMALNIISTTPTQIVADLPPGILTGDQLLTVSTGKGQSQNDEYDLTFGTMGPPGPTGATGAMGAPGATGAQGPPGVTDASGLVVYEGQSGLVSISNGSSQESDSMSCNSGDIALGLAAFKQINIVSLPRSQWSWTRTAPDTIDISVTLSSSCSSSVGCFVATAKILCLDTTP
jgi:hypothetical protein